jgi:hypothetical protein
MPKKSVKVNLDISEKNISGWDQAISDAKKQIESAKDRISTLRGTIQFFSSMKERGEPFPGQQSANNLRPSV